MSTQSGTAIGSVEWPVLRAGDLVLRGSARVGNHYSVTHWLFSYGTLRQAEVQQSLFGRSVPTVEDSLSGWRLDWMLITDSAVVATSGSDRHPILVPGVFDDVVRGSALHLSDRELVAADEYEVERYTRVVVTLLSGRTAYVYAARA